LLQLTIFLFLKVTPCLFSYNATVSVMIKSKKHQRLADPLLQSGVVTRSCAIKSTFFDEIRLPFSKFGKNVSI